VNPQIDGPASGADRYLVRMIRDVARDRISIDGLVITTIVGALPHERELAQPLQIDLSITTDLGDAGASDELGDTVNYGSVVEQVAAAVREAKDILLERLADRVAEVVLGFERVDAVDVAVTKLRPPVAEQVATTSVHIHRRRADLAFVPAARHRAIVALGSNLGDRPRFLADAVSQLGDVVAASQVYETAPVGGPDNQGPYLNMVVVVDTHLDPFAFFRRCQRIESSALRQRVVRWGPRTLDVDILFFDDAVIQSSELCVPHPRLGERRFVLAPLADVAPELCPAGWDEELPPERVVAVGPLEALIS
jgi:dihydroneopterin aldolase / 2-amino-4-hydroxy-6-hydroxymethyldihydropteridine diphosphokinase